MSRSPSRRSGGSLFDEMLERSAAMAGIVDALNSRHPLVQGIAASVDVMDAQDQVRAWYPRARGLGAQRCEPADQGARHVQGRHLDAAGTRRARRRSLLLRFRHRAGDCAWRARRAKATCSASAASSSAAASARSSRCSKARRPATAAEAPSRLQAPETLAMSSGATSPHSTPCGRLALRRSPTR